MCSSVRSRVTAGRFALTTAKNVKPSRWRIPYRLCMPDAREVLLVLDDICRHLDGDMSLETLARRSGWSPHHLQRAIKRVAGETPKQLVLRLRLERAAAALIATEYSVLRIAIDGGFSSHEVFTRAFRRHFGCAPRDYRADHGGMLEAERHRAVVEASGPCLRLHRQSLHPPRAKPPMTPPEITIRELAEQPILYIEARVPMAQIAGALGKILPRVFGHCQQRGLPLAGPPVVLYGAMTPGQITLQGAMPLAEPAEGDGDIEAGTLPGGKAAVAVHIGPYDELPETHAALEKWLEAEGHETRGPRWEVYLTDPSTTPDPKDWRTEVVASLS